MVDTSKEQRMKKPLIFMFCLCFLVSFLLLSGEQKEDPLLLHVKPAKITSLKKEAFAWLEANGKELSKINDEIGRLAEIAMEEYESAELLAAYLEKNEFQVTRGVAGMPTAFVAAPQPWP